MYDDIVTRLYCSYANPPCESCTFCAARAEIERLREEVNRWRKIAELFTESHPQFDAFHAYFKEVRGG